MKHYRDLKLIGSAGELEKVIEVIETSLCDGWTRDKDREEAKLKKDLNLKLFCFVSPKTNSRPGVSLSLRFDRDQYLCVNNIVPLEIGQLSIEDHNSILEEFLTKFVEPAVQNLNIKIDTTPAERTIDNSMSPELATKLKRFSGAANKSSGGTHHFDEKRFFDFIVQAHHESSELDESMLQKLLIDERWYEDDALELSIKYRFGRYLLKQYDS